MGVIGFVLETLFGGRRNVVAETAEVFRENAERAGARGQVMQMAAMAQFGQEFLDGRRGWFDRVMDGVNRLPRPMMALGCIGLFVAAMVDPVWFADRMAGVALVPEPLWWLLGVVVSFYFGARHQAKGQDFQKDIAQKFAQSQRVLAQVTDVAEGEASDNPALAAWRRTTSP